MRFSLCVVDGKVQKGLKGEYFSNVTLSGVPRSPASTSKPCSFSGRLSLPIPTCFHTTSTPFDVRRSQRLQQRRSRLGSMVTMDTASTSMAVLCCRQLEEALTKQAILKDFAFEKRPQTPTIFVSNTTSQPETPSSRWCGRSAGKEYRGFGY